MAWLGDEDVAIHDDCQRFRHEQNPLYLAMFFNSEPFARQKQRFITESKVVRIAGDEIAQIEIPLPPLEKQNEIADGMMASLEVLNAIEEELRARRKQFEYYRDKLLYFPEKAVSA
jgi:type I restriction enzyme S subunit